MAFNLTRRKFLQSASLAAVALPLSDAIASETGIEPSPFEPKGTVKDETVVGGVCEMCFWRCQLVGKKRGDRLVKLEGNPHSIDNGSSICARGNAGVQLLYDPDRLKYPLKNVGERGNPKWKRISWEEALDECGSKLKAIEEKYGAHGISVFPHGSSAKYPMHFFERTVGTHNVSEASFFQCRGIRDTAYLATIGMAPGEYVDMPNAKVIFLLGGHFGENIHVSHIKQYIKGLQNGAKLVVVDPRYSASAAKSDIWVQIKPGTDTAFLLAIMNYLISNNKHNAEFIDEYGDGFDEFKEGITDWTLEKAAKECEIPAEQIKEVAELLAANAPNVSIHPGRHVSWYGNDFQRQRALACLTGVLGAFFVKGGWVPAKTPKVGKTSWAKKEHDDEFNLNMDEEEEPLFPYSPPGTPTELIRDTALSGKPYPIKGCVIWGQNPIQTIPGQEKMKDVLRQMDFVMCVDVMPTDITMWADILLPEASYLERYDLIKTGTQWDFADSHQQYIAPRIPLAEPMFERRDQVYITNEIAKRMGYESDIPVQSNKELVEKDLLVAGLTLEQIIKEGGIHIQKGQDPYTVPEDFEVIFYNEDIEDAGFPGIPTYQPVEQPPKGYARLLYGRVPVHTFNRTQNNVWLNKSMPENPVWINDAVATALGLKDGDMVGFINQDGVKSRTKTTVKTTPGIRKDSVYMAHGYGSANPLMSVGVNAGVDDTSLISKITVDPETGAHGMRNNFIQLIKDDKILAIPASV
ncbi:molybdopterin-dependent oxidoreductase [Desulforhopalus sp. IMCC35007]|uniref:molybdopterin-containing oxidoreductase family protein n=1 Tax=Desulforhopalus sp. IMCC35007 TaxID=2569543 RepID=UPI0010AECA89|nr:molybdopterin-dependent oxidoreductase [Desulforhopalus sp. IMCC35007]TKB10348.1 twin-arginine translocation pathway signal protein [Desulforhopalus sp. IMCC35007]